MQAKAHAHALVLGAMIRVSPQPHNRIRLSVTAANRMNFKNLIRKRIITKGFSFYKKYIFGFNTILCCTILFFDPTCLICYLTKTFCC